MQCQSPGRHAQTWVNSALQSVAMQSTAEPQLSSMHCQHASLLAQDGPVKGKGVWGEALLLASESGVRLPHETSAPIATSHPARARDPMLTGAR